MTLKYLVLEDAYLPDLFAGGKHRVAKAGEVVYRFDGATYGCISPVGLACSRIDGVGPFFEVSYENLRPVKRDTK